VLRVQELDLQALAQQHSILGQLIADHQKLQPAHKPQQQQHQELPHEPWPRISSSNKQQQQQDVDPVTPPAAGESTGQGTLFSVGSPPQLTPPAARSDSGGGSGHPPLGEEDTEKLVAQLFDAELQQRLQLAAAAAAGDEPSPSTTRQRVPRPGLGPAKQQEAQEEQEQGSEELRPGWTVPAAAAGALRPLPPGLAAHVSPWAPLPPAQVDR
jgi:hypothetical protein